MCLPSSKSFKTNKMEELTIQCTARTHNLELIIHCRINVE